MTNDKFDKPINKWITEEEQTTNIVNNFDPLTRKITQEEKTETKKVKVIYEETSIDANFCQNKTHIWHVIDSHKYIIKCKRCPLHKHISPGNEYIDQDGHVRLRSNDTVIA